MAFEPIKGTSHLFVIKKTLTPALALKQLMNWLKNLEIL